MATSLEASVEATLSTLRVTTGNRRLAECQEHSEKALIHSAKALPSVTLGKQTGGEATFAECFFSGTRQSFTMCQHALGKTKQHSAK
jgi:hypothetical protein